MLRIATARVAAPSVCFAVACILLAAAPTAPPCFHRWRRSSPLLLPRGGLGIPESFASSPEAPLLGELAGASPTERLDEGRLDREALARLNLSVSADTLPPPLPRGGLGIPQSFASSPEAPPLGQRRRPPPAAETGSRCWGRGQQDASDSAADAGCRNPALARSA